MINTRRFLCLLVVVLGCQLPIYLRKHPGAETDSDFSLSPILSGPEEELTTRFASFGAHKSGPMDQGCE
jgi:hypothetical protein